MEKNIPLSIPWKCPLLGDSSWQLEVEGHNECRSDDHDSGVGGWKCYWGNLVQVLLSPGKCTPRQLHSFFLGQGSLCLYLLWASLRDLRILLPFMQRISDSKINRKTCHSKQMTPQICFYSPSNLAVSSKKLSLSSAHGMAMCLVTWGRNVHSC